MSNLSSVIDNKKLLNAYNSTRKTKYKNLFCHAPFTSMNFQQNGEVLVCCYNREYVIGKFPEQSLKEIWFGEKATKLRNKFNENNLDKGCYLCVKQLESSNFEGLHAKNYDEIAFTNNYSKEFVDYPKVMEFEISNQCNLECTMCTGYYSSSIRKNREKLPPSKFYYQDGFVEQLKEFIPHLDKAKFLGGEPFLIKEYIELWETIGALNPNIEVSITTNGTIMNERVRNAIEKLNVWIVISIDSVIEETYHKIRINANFNRVMANVTYFQAYSKRKQTGISFAVCPIIDNWHEMAEITSYCTKKKISLFFNTVIRPEEKSLKFQSPDMLQKILRKLKKDYYSKGLFLGFASKNVKQYRSLINQIEQWSANYELVQKAIQEKLKILKQSNKQLTLPSYIDPDCYNQLLVLISSDFVLNSNSEEQKKDLSYLINESEQNYEITRSTFGDKMFIFCLFYAANQFVHIFDKSNFLKPVSIELILDKLSKTLNKLDYWHILSKNLFHVDPTQLINSIPFHLAMDEIEFENTLKKG